MFSSSLGPAVYFPGALVLMNWSIGCEMWIVGPLKSFPMFVNLSSILNIEGFKDLQMLFLSRTVRPQDGRPMRL